MGYEAHTIGFVGTIEVETLGADRVWFSLTDSDDRDDWIHAEDSDGNSKRAWFQMNMKYSTARPVELAKLSLLMEAMRERQQVIVYHPKNMRRNINRMVRPDTYNCLGVRSLRVGIRK